MVQAVFCDFYGTLVHEDGEVINAICQEIMRTGRAENTRQIAGVLVGYLSRGLPPVLWRRLPDPAAAGVGCPGPDDPRLSLLRRLQRLEPAPVRALAVSPLPSRTPAIFLPGARCRSTSSPTSTAWTSRPRSGITIFPQQACSPARTRNPNKPRPELFRLALAETGLAPGEVIHIGDSLSSDVGGAAPLGTLRLVAESKQPACPRRGPPPFLLLRKFPQILRVL